MSGKEIDREIWETRFKKMLDVENRSVEEYQKLLDECKAHRMLPVAELHLNQLIRDETKHSILVKKLIRLLDE